jgi:VanZ family protein
MSKFLRWIPALIMMTIIFISSSTPSANLPNYGLWDTLIKKGGHMLGYGVLSLCYWYGFGFNQKQGWLSWFLTLVYAVSDEVHQSFTPGRHPSPVDVLLFDGGGAALSLYITAWVLRLRNRNLFK